MVLRYFIVKKYCVLLTQFVDVRIKTYICVKITQNTSCNNIPMNSNKSQFYSYEYPHPAVTTDCVILGFDGKCLNILLIERGNEPFKGMWALPGGFVRMDETAEECAKRELREETGLKDIFIEQFYVFSDVTRDPRERVITIAFYGLVKKTKVFGGDDAAKAQWFKMDNMPPLAFDHGLIIQTAMDKLRKKIHFEPIGFELLPDVFTMSQLQHLYEAILDVKFDRRNFYRKMTSLEVLTAEEREFFTSRRIPTKYRFNKIRYEELKKQRRLFDF